MKKRILGIVLCLVMALSLLPTTAFAAGYKAGDIAGTTGAGTQSDPVICDSFAELKAALEYDGDLYICVNNFFNPNSLSYYNLVAGTDYVADSFAIKIKSSTVKYLEVNADIEIRASDTKALLYSFIDVAGNLTVSGRGKLSVAFNAPGYPSAVFFIASPGKLIVNDTVTIDGTSIGNGFGRAIYNYSGYLDIREGTFTGASYQNADDDTDAVLIDKNAFSSTISGGNFKASSVHGTAYGLAVRGTPSVMLTGGTYYGINAGTEKNLRGMLGEYVKYEYVDGAVYSPDGVRMTTSALKVVPDLIDVTSVSVTCPGYKLGGNIADAVPTTTTAGVTISNYEWLDNNGNKLTGGTFAADTQYRVSVYLKAKDGYSIAGLTKANAKFNGKETTYFYNPTSGDASRLGQAQLYHYPDTLSVPVSAYVTAVDITCPGYKIGGKITDAVPVTTTAGVTISKYVWYDNNGNELTGGTFATDTQYRVAVYLTAKDGYSLANLTKDNVKFNGKTTSYFNNPTSGVEVDLGQAKLYHYPDALKSEPAFLKGDVNGDGVVTDADAVYLLYYTFFGDGEYPVNQPCDFNGDGVVTDADAVYLLYYTFFGAEEYPLH